ncbi:MAG: hypothetical protein ACI4QT_08670, partial [Kiritimatiellia bacterium]
MNHNKIPYALVGRTEDYPENIGSDIDIVIARSGISDFQRIIWEMEDADTKVVSMFQHEIVAFYYVIFHFDGNKRVFIQPDVCTDYYRKGRLLLTADFLLERRRKAPKGEFFVLAPEREFVYYLLKKIDKRSLSPVQFEHLRLVYLQDKNAALRDLSSFWNEADVHIIQEAFEKNRCELLLEHGKRLQEGIHTSHSIRPIDKLKDCVLKLKRILQPTGFVLAVMGPDGSGKSTFLNQFEKDIQPAFRRMQRFHLFPVPEAENATVVSNPHEKKPRGPFLSLCKLCYYLALYRSGHIRYVLPKKIRSTLTIYDRYFDDIVIDPIRYRNGISTRIVRLFCRFIPRPDQWFFLDCPTGVIQARKAEVTAEETERQRQAYLKLADARKN